MKLSMIVSLDAKPTFCSKYNPTETPQLHKSTCNNYIRAHVILTVSQKHKHFVDVLAAET